MPTPKKTKEEIVEKKPAVTKKTNIQEAGSAHERNNGETVPEPSNAPTYTPAYYEEKQTTTSKKGVLEVMPEGYGFLRANGLMPSNEDIYISQSQIRRFDIRPGDEVEGQVRPPKETERYYGMLKVEKINNAQVEESAKRPRFEHLTPIYPNRQVKLEVGKKPLSTRIIEGDVLSSNFDDPPEHQTRVAELSLERAKRLVETGIDVVMLLDSITRLGRAYNLALPPSGRTLSGGFDPVALYPPKKFFGAARNFEDGGSLIIVATALVDTGSPL